MRLCIGLVVLYTGCIPTHWGFSAWFWMLWEVKSWPFQFDFSLASYLAHSRLLIYGRLYLGGVVFFCFWVALGVGLGWSWDGILGSWNDIKEEERRRYMHMHWAQVSLRLYVCR